MKQPAPDTPSPAVLMARAEAAAWITRLHGPNRSDDMEEGFRRWLASSPENAAEFDGLNEVWDFSVQRVAVQGVPRLHRLHTSRHKVRWAQAAVLAVVFVVGALAVSVGTRGTSYSTAIGEQRLVLLPDGSKVSMNSDTLVRVKYEKSRRRLLLERGEAYFEVSKDAQRPFAVVAGSREVVALGTSFVVRYEPDRTAVTLMEGKVTVGARSDGLAAITSSRAPAQVLQPGERLVLIERGGEHKDRPDLGAVVAWRRGEVLLEDTPLRQAVAEMNRYDKAQIIIDSDAVATLNVSGLYHTGDNRGFAAAVAKMHGLQVVERDERLHLQK